MAASSGQRFFYVRSMRFSASKIIGKHRYELAGEMSASEPVTPVDRCGKQKSAECSADGASKRIYQHTKDREGKEIVLMYRMTNREKREFKTVTV